MKSVIAQGSTVVKAIEEALKKANMPQEFFVKLLEEAQSGFLGFGSKKAKIALFYTKDSHDLRQNEVLSQNIYQDLFDNKSLEKQIDHQQRGSSHQPKTEQSRQHGQQRQHRNQPKQGHHQGQKRALTPNQENSVPKTTDMVQRPLEAKSENKQQSGYRRQRRSRYYSNRPRYNQGDGNRHENKSQASNVKKSYDDSDDKS